MQKTTVKISNRLKTPDMVEFIWLASSG